MSDTDDIARTRTLDHLREMMIRRLQDSDITYSAAVKIVSALDDYVDRRIALIIVNTDWSGANLVRVGSALEN